MHRDFDFHPDEPTVRIFGTPRGGVVRLDNNVAVSRVSYGSTVLWHYAFAHHWFKINVTTDRHGELVETGDPDQRFAFNCDIATPMERDGDDKFSVDLFIDVLIRADANSYVVGDEDEFEDALTNELLSQAEAVAARTGLNELVTLIQEDRLLPWLHDIAPLGPCKPPKAPPMQRAPVPERLQPRVRRTW